MAMAVDTERIRQMMELDAKRLATPLSQSGSESALLAPLQRGGDWQSLSRTLSEVIPRLQVHATSGASGDGTAMPTPERCSVCHAYCRCSQCHDAGWLINRAPLGDPERGRLLRCRCRAGEDVARQARVSGLLDQTKTLETFERRDGTGAALAAALAVAEGRKAFGYIYSMEKGTGKSHLLAAIGNRLLDGGSTVYITNWRGLLRSIYRLRDDQAGLDALLYRLATVGGLLVDEVRYKVTDWMWEHLHEMFDARYQRRLTTVFTSNFSLDELEGNALRLAETDQNQTDQLDTLTSRLRDRRVSVVARNEASDYRQVAQAEGGDGAP